MNAVINQAARGRLRFDRSLQQAKGEAGEATRQVIEEPGRQEVPVILRVDASKLIHGREPKVSGTQIVVRRATTVND